MIAAWMLYSLLTFTLMGVTALALERLCRLCGWATRWIWVGAMLAPLLLPLIASESRTPTQQSAVAATGSASRPMSLHTNTVVRRGELPLAVRINAHLGSAHLDSTLRTAWVAMSAAMGLLILVGWLRLLRRSHAWTHAELAGMAVLVTDAAGPAVLGVLRPRIIVPRWLLSADAATQGAVIAHERAHLAAHDSRLAAAALLLVLLMPWNLPLWQLWRRLRAAIEVDCDARVLRAGHSAEQYGAALLRIAEQHTLAPLLALAMRDCGSALEQRIRLLFPQPPRFRVLTVGALLSSAIAFAAAAAQVDAPLSRASVPAQSSLDPARSTLGRELLGVAEDGDVAAATRLIAAGADVNHAIAGDGAPLIIAARHGNLPLLRLLLERGAAPNLAVLGDGNALIMGAKYGHPDVVSALLERGADVNAVVIGDETPLINAATSGHLAIVLQLVEQGADIRLAVPAENQPGAEIRSPLSEARKHGHRDVVEYLQAKGAR